MLGKLILLFTIIPIVELALILKLNSYIGLSYTLLIVLLTGVAGAYLAKKEGRGILNNIKMDMAQGRMPGDELVNGLCVLIGGAFLLTPGLLTDVTGFILVIPFTRGVLKSFIKRRLRQMVEDGTFTFYYRK
ncbi:FxsA family protein [Alkaliphilus transvaalensis]|uniref:FxsA family protein n=1 Tax=Alkaliphilus transvaalensis TaxID=114628 RepID=UPI00047AE3E6|nr:FxsA family protein [Alkaliphilus transvaalensis]